MRDVLGDFMPTWKPDSGQTWFTQKRKRKPSIDASPTLRDLWRWTARHPPDGPGPSIPHGLRFQDLYEHLLDLDEEKLWHFDRPIGKGSFGAVALFKKVGEDGNIIDDVIIKTARAEKRLMVNIDGGLATEAAIMAQLNTLDNNFLLALREYKFLDRQPQLRFYLEHCEYGDLNRLHLRYKAWQMRFPELFLWHLLHCLSVGIGGENSLASGSFRSLEPKTFGEILPGAFVLHKDIKLENTFFGRPVGDKGYGRVCVADFGVSSILTPRGLENHANLQGEGTPTWASPECRVDDMKKRLFVRPFMSRNHSFVSRRTVVGTHRLTPSANVWPIGAMLLSLVTGRDISDLDRVICRIFDRALVPWEPHIMLPIRTGAKEEYSTELLELIRDCLKFNPSARPSPSELRQRAEQGLAQRMQIEEQLHAQNPELTDQRLRVYCHENEIQNQPLGDANYDLNPVFWRRFVEDQIWLPSEWGPLWPPNAPEHLKAPEHWPYHIRKQFADMKEKARLQHAERGYPSSQNTDVNL